MKALAASGSQHRVRAVRAIVFGSDQGLVGRFNERVAEHAHAALVAMPGAHEQPAEVWAVGERVHDRLPDAGLQPRGLFQMPGSVQDITPPLGQILTATASGGANTTPADDPDNAELHLFYNRPGPAAGWAPVGQRLLPLDSAWREGLIALPWPGLPLPELIADVGASVGALLREHLFVSLFRACAESLASENASRLAAMERADRNIEELLLRLNASFHRRRQSSIDAELFDVMAGFDALSVQRGRHGADAA
jgi:F-type H+-transporting ATPase subunit gamma